MEFDKAYHEALHTVADYWGLTPQSVESALKEADEKLEASLVRLYGEEALSPAKDDE